MSSLNGKTLILLGITCALVTSDNTTVIKIEKSPTLEGYKVEVVQSDNVTILTLENEDGVAVSKTYSGHGIQVVQSRGSTDCLMPQLVTDPVLQDQNKKCKVKTLMTGDQVPADVANFCKTRPVYSLQHAECKGAANRVDRSCCEVLGCLNCIGSCCGFGFGCEWCSNAGYYFGTTCCGFLSTY